MDERARAEGLDRFLDGLADGEAVDGEVDPVLAQIARHYRAIGQSPAPSGARDRVRRRILSYPEDLLRGSEDRNGQAPDEDVAQLAAGSRTWIAVPTAAARLSEAPWSTPTAPDDLATSPVRGSAPRLRWVVAQAATAALLLVTLVASFLAFGPGRLERQHLGAITETLLDVQVDALPAGHASVGVRDWTLLPSTTPLTMPPLGGPGFITVAAGAITVTVDGAEQGLTTGQHLSLSGDTAVTVHAAGTEAARVLEFYAVPSFTEAGRGLGETSVDVSTWAYDPVMYTVEYLITASPDRLPGGPSHLILDRLTVPPGTALPPQLAQPLTWTAVGEGTLGLTLDGERLPVRWTSGDERTFRRGQVLPNTPGTRMTLRNAGKDPLILYRLTLIPREAPPQPP